MKKATFPLAFLATMLFSACRPGAAEVDEATGEVAPTRVGRSVARQLSDGLNYYRDEATGLCFAVYVPPKTGDISEITSVPCEALGRRVLRFESRW